jgi:hypothetical protein
MAANSGTGLGRTCYPTRRSRLGHAREFTESSWQVSWAIPPMPSRRPSTSRPQVCSRYHLPRRPGGAKWDVVILFALWASRGISGEGPVASYIPARRGRCEDSLGPRSGNSRSSVSAVPGQVRRCLCTSAVHRPLSDRRRRRGRGGSGNVRSAPRCGPYRGCGPRPVQRRQVRPSR